MPYKQQRIEGEKRMNLILKYLGFGTFGIGVGIFVGLNLIYYDWQWGLIMMILGIIEIFYESINGPTIQR